MSSSAQFTVGGGGGMANIQTLTGNTGGAVGPTANNVNILGAGFITVTGNPGTSTLTISLDNQDGYYKGDHKWPTEHDS